MKVFRLIVSGLFLLFISHASFAQWVGIASSNDRGGYEVYLDPNSRTVVDESVTFWLIFDYKTLQQYADSLFLSYEIELEINCINQQGRILGFVDFLEPMGGGQPNRISFMPQDWVPLSAAGKDELIWSLACEGSPTAFAPGWLIANMK